MRDTSNDIKAGDKVTFNKQDHDAYNYDITPGKEYTVKSLDHDGANPFVEVINDRGRAATWYARRFTKVQPKADAKFKVGDIVECIERGGYGSLGNQKVGDRFTVAFVDGGCRYLGFTGVDTKAEWYASRFIVVSRDTQVLAPVAAHKWIVCALDSKGNIKPASQPRIMAGESQAITVSKYMAAKYTGKTFAVVSYTVGKTFRAEAVEVKTVTHEVRQVG